MAHHLKLPLPVASQYLRALEARGLLTVRRVGGRVKYRISSAPLRADAQELVRALRRAFQRDADPIAGLVKLATAFTQPRRIEIFRALKQGAQAPRQLKAFTGMSARALARHLRKLETRGFVVSRQGRYSVIARREGFACALARLASG